MYQHWYNYLYGYVITCVSHYMFNSTWQKIWGMRAYGNSSSDFLWPFVGTFWGNMPNRKQADFKTYVYSDILVSWFGNQGAPWEGIMNWHSNLTVSSFSSFRLFSRMKSGSMRSQIWYKDQTLWDGWSMNFQWFLST